MNTVKHPFNYSDISRLDGTTYKEIASWPIEKIQWNIEHVCACHIPSSHTLCLASQDRVLRKLRKALATKRPLESGDVVRIKSGEYENTGVVNRIDSITDMVNVFTTKNNPSGLGTWFNKKDLKRIGRVHNRE